MAKKQREDVLGYKAIREDIKANSCRNLYVFYGDETHLLYHYADALRKHLINSVTESFNFHKYSSDDFSMDDFLNSVDNLPMMSEHSMIQLDDIDLFSLKDDDRDRLADVLNDIPEYCTILCIHVTSPWKPDKRKKKLWDAISQNGSIIEFSKLDIVDLAPWVERSFQKYGKQISSKLCRHLIETTDGTMTTLSSEIAKISAFSSSKEICEADINAVVEPIVEVVVFQMTDMISIGKYDTAFHLLNTLVKQQDPLTILGAIGSTFRRMYAAKILSDKGKSHSELSRLYNLPEYPAKKTMQAVKNLRRKYLADCLKNILETDWLIKNSLDEKERLIELLVIKLAMESSHG